MTAGTLYRVTNPDAPVAGATVEFVQTTDHRDPFAEMIFGLAGDVNEYRIVGEIDPEIQAAFDEAFADREELPEGVDIRRVYLYDSEVELVEAAA